MGVVLEGSTGTVIGVCCGVVLGGSTGSVIDACRGTVRGSSTGRCNRQSTWCSYSGVGWIWRVGSQCTTKCIHWNNGRGFCRGGRWSIGSWGSEGNNHIVGIHIGSIVYIKVGITIIDNVFLLSFAFILKKSLCCFFYYTIWKIVVHQQLTNSK